jgi:hypothetical protein
MMVKSTRGFAQDGYRPITEGYQPKFDPKDTISRGFMPQGNSEAAPAKSPSGGSSAKKPADKQ